MEPSEESSNQEAPQRGNNNVPAKDAMSCDESSDENNPEPNSVIDSSRCANLASPARTPTRFRSKSVSDPSVEDDQDNNNVPAEDVMSYDESSDENKTRRNSVIDSFYFDFATPSTSTRFRSKSESVPSSKYNALKIVETQRAKLISQLDTANPPKVAVARQLTVADAHPSPLQDIDDLIESHFVTTAAHMPVAKDAENYNMNHKNRGKCVIFNHEKFEISTFANREGSTADANSLQKSFSQLGFAVEVYTDLSHHEILEQIEKLRKHDHTDNDCLCVIVLTHGLQNDFISSKDVAYNSDRIWEPFTADKCTTLAGKPKLFFFQACRGEKVDSGVMLSPRSLINSSTTETDSVSSYKIPTHADFLIAHSSVKGFYTWRDPEAGTWYIQCLCEVLDKYGSEYDLMTLLTMTARKVATDCASYNPEDQSMHGKKQVPAVTTMLTRTVYFPPKSDQISPNSTEIPNPFKIYKL